MRQHGRSLGRMTWGTSRRYVRDARWLFLQIMLGTCRSIGDVERAVNCAAALVDSAAGTGGT